MHSRWIPAAAIAALVSISACADPEPADPGSDEGRIPVTTSSAEALELFVEGRDLAEKLRATDGRALLEKAVELDPGFASAWLALANAAGSNEQFFSSLKQATETAGGVSEAERMMIEALNAAIDGNPDRQMEIISELADAYPNDERVHNVLGNLYAARQEYDEAIAHYRAAIESNPDYSPPYNSMGYAARAAGRFDVAEEAFRQYIEVLPGEPNPHDSYAEFLMKIGRFDESIEHYRAALAADADFTPSYVGIANNQMFQGDGEGARATLAEMSEGAATENIRRNAIMWTAASYLHEGNVEAALESLTERLVIARDNRDALAQSNDRNQIGMMFLWMGDTERAERHFEAAIDVLADADIPQGVKEGTARNHLYNKAMIAIKRGDLEAAGAAAAAYHEEVIARNVPFEVRQDHELMGRIALAEGVPGEAITHLEYANQQDPRILYAIAEAYQANGDDTTTAEYAGRAANLNQLNFALSYVRASAQALAGE